MTAADTILSDLAAIVGPSHVLAREDVSSRYDGYPQTVPLLALCIVRPANTEQVAAVLRYCDTRGIAVVPHGGRTGLSAGARATPLDVCLALERMCAIEEVDPLGATMVVEAGVPLQRVQEAAHDAGMLYPVDLGARGSAMIGGTIATNAGGNSVLRYGVTRDQVLGLEVVLANGTILSSMNRMMKNNAGFDLKQLFIGSEGTLGVVTRAVLRLSSLPGSRATALLGVASFNDVLALLKLMGASSGGALNSFELMWPEYFDVVLASGKHKPPFEQAQPFYVLVEIVSDQCQETVEAAVEEAWEQSLVEDAVIASSEKQAESLWTIRDDVESMMHAHKPLFLYDVSMRQTDMAAYVHGVRTQLTQRWPGSVAMVFGHVADGNLYVCISTGDEAHHHDVDALVYGMLQPVGGSISAEHGIGLEKLNYLHLSRTEEEIAVMHNLKRLFDPRNTLNPGKVIADVAPA